MPLNFSLLSFLQCHQAERKAIVWVRLNGVQSMRQDWVLTINRGVTHGRTEVCTVPADGPDAHPGTQKIENSPYTKKDHWYMSKCKVSTYLDLEE